MGRALFPSYENFDYPDTLYNDFIVRLDYVRNTLAPFRKVRVKNNTGERFDG